MEERSDAELVRLARAGSKYAFHQLIERYQLMAMGLALRLCREEETARDLVQEAILQAFLSLDHLQDPTRFKNWLYGIVFNVCRNWRRTVAQRPSLSLEAQEEETLHQRLFSYRSGELSVDPLTMIETDELRRLVQEVLQLLSPKNRLVAQLFYYEELSVQAIASHLNISQTAVKNRLHKGREQLRTHLLPLYPELAYRGTNRSVEEKMIPVTVARVVQQDTQARSAVILVDRHKQRAMPLWFPQQENMTLRQHMQMFSMFSQQDRVAEPTTLDLMVAMLTSLGSEIKKVEIDAFQGHILYAQLSLRSSRGKQTLKAHLNDALPLAVQLHCPFFVSGEVWRQRGIDLQGKGATLAEQLDTLIALVSTTFSPLTTKSSGKLDFVDGLADWTIRLDRKQCDYRLDSQTTYTGKPALLITLQDCRGMVQLCHEEDAGRAVPWAPHSPGGLHKNRRCAARQPPSLRDHAFAKSSGAISRFPFGRK
ncbi:sigma-70 family RNA polymerase sigma factor [Ktedonosporobacter rubrisoli]|uniref:Sigma-70 family RNA polymerase sigma factor n=1 Tax=Ktedonosporobacter rubrisoli TaxID=2509675 RepID=A0A4P6JMP2_KTERU|nr:bifunctional nuclease domain-containing protein [Ktedonosporobacter rubrisoli]QBD76548.1 sigma-70 family RNA polymerase sigma factor [Ktedonosporobacter rubrisoli]